MLFEEVSDKMVPLHLRLKLFHSVVAPSVLYGCGSCLITEARETRLKSVQLKMMRQMRPKVKLQVERTLVLLRTQRSL